jgi:hypothetical protein
VKKSLADSRDFNASRRQGFALRKLGYKVGSYFKGCRNCGDTHFEEMRNGREVERYDSGYAVWRSYCPGQTGWTYWCYECGAKDRRCWEDAKDIGEDAVRGTRDAITSHKKSGKAGRSRQRAVSDVDISAFAKSVGRIFDK